MDISVIVITYNSAHCIEKCIHDAISALEASDLSGEIIVFENGSLDGTPEILNQLESTYASKLKVIYSNQNMGTTISRNAAIHASVGEFLLVLDSDAYLNTDCLVEMHSFLNAHSEYGLVGPRLKYKSGNFQLSYDSFPTLQRKLQRFLYLRNIEGKVESNNPELDVDYLISACWLFSRKLFDLIGPLDEKIFYSPEDVDYCIRIWKAGYKIGYLNNVSMVHDAQELSRGKKLNKFTFLHAYGLMYYFFKHRYFFSFNRLSNRINKAVSKRAI